MRLKAVLGAIVSVPLITVRITSISSNPDAMVRGVEAVAAAEADVRGRPGAPVMESSRT